jgi:hypothetical protein
MSASTSPLFGNGSRGKNRQAKMGAAQPLDPRWQEVAIEAQGQRRQCWGGHRRAAKEGLGDALIHLLIGEQVRCSPRRSTAIARRAATGPFGINSPPVPRNRRIMRSTAGLFAARSILQIARSASPRQACRIGVRSHASGSVCSQRISTSSTSMPWRSAGGSRMMSLAVVTSRLWARSAPRRKAAISLARNR